MKPTNEAPFLIVLAPPIYTHGAEQNRVGFIEQSPAVSATLSITSRK